LKAVEVSDKLADRLNDETFVQQAATEALLKIGHLKPVVRFVDSADLKNDELLGFLRGIPDLVIPALGDSIKRDLLEDLDLEIVIRILLEFQEEAVPLLTTCLEHKAKWFRLAALEALGEIGGSRARDSIMRMLALNDDEIRMAAVKALNQVGYPSDMIAPEFRMYERESGLRRAGQRRGEKRSR
jgi:HEAT repeat protein